MSKEKVKVSIDDMNFYVVGGDDPNYVKGLAKDLDVRIKEIQVANYRLNQVQSLILTALNILDEKEKLKKEETIIENSKNDENVIRNNIKEIENLRKIVDSFDEERKEYKDNIIQLKNKLSEVEDLNKDLKTKNENYLLEIDELKEKTYSLKNEKEILEEQIYDSQKRIIDLNREIESINESK
ncbi:MAG: cell division protein ZapA [Peptoniphilaceae bacterium]